MKIEDYDQLLGQIGHAAMEERQLLILSHVNAKAKVSKVAVWVTKVQNKFRKIKLFIKLLFQLGKPSTKSKPTARIQSNK